MHLIYFTQSLTYTATPHIHLRSLSSGPLRLHSSDSQSIDAAGLFFTCLGLSAKRSPQRVRGAGPSSLGGNTCLTASVLYNLRLPRDCAIRVFKDIEVIVGHLILDHVHRQVQMPHAFLSSSLTYTYMATKPIGVHECTEGCAWRACHQVLRPHFFGKLKQPSN